MYLSKRTILLFHTLSKSVEPLTSNYLSQVVGVTSRTVKKDLQVLSEIIASYGAKLNSKPGSGYQIYVCLLYTSSRPISKTGILTSVP